MKDCTKCVHAKWYGIEGGKLHPSGDGECTKEIKLPQLPASKRYRHNPVIAGGYINRLKQLKEHCVYYSV